jgi:hypothetical protein
LFCGLFLLYKVSPLVTVCLIALYVYLVIRQIRFNTDRARAERILGAYDRVRLYRPEADDKAIFTEALRIYLRDAGYDENTIASAGSIILELKESVVTLSEFISRVLAFESPIFSRMNFASSRSVNSTFAKHRKRESIIQTILARRENRDRAPMKRPELSKGLIQRVESSGLRVDELSVEQVMALESAENPARYHWLAREAGWIAIFLAFFAVIELFKLNLVLAAIEGAISLGIMYLVWRTQTARAMRMFQEASIQKYAEDRRKVATGQD